MNKVIMLFTCPALGSKGADMPTETQHYITVIRQNIFKNYKGMFKPAQLFF